MERQEKCLARAPCRSRTLSQGAKGIHRRGLGPELGGLGQTVGENPGESPRIQELVSCLPVDVRAPNSFTAFMRLVFVALLAGLAWGCAANKAGGPDARVGETKAPSNAPPYRAREGAKPALVPDLGVYGKVLLVNSALRFVVMDFPIRRMPALEQR